MSKRTAVDIKTELRKLAIVGCYFTSIDAPFDDPGFEIWTLNQNIEHLKDKRIDVYFDLHDWESANYRPDYVDLIPWDREGLEIINTVNYPYAEVCARYGFFWENSLPLMLGLAGHRDFKAIYLYGCEREEFITSPKMGWSLFHVIGALRREGCQVFFVNEYALDYSGIYGFKDLQKTSLGKGFKFK